MKLYIVLDVKGPDPLDTDPQEVADTVIAHAQGQVEGYGHHGEITKLTFVGAEWEGNESVLFP